MPLGTLPPASSLSGIALFDQPSASASRALNAMQSFATLPALVTALGASPTTSSVKPSSAMVLSSALPPITAKLVAKITSGQFVAMKELLADNMSLCHQLESFPTHQHLFSGMTKPRLREIDSPLTWVSCFLAYAAVKTTDQTTRNLLTYGRLVIREAQRHSGPGWLEYDRIFRQHAALSPSTVWHEVNPSLHASTVLSYRTGLGQVCKICHELDHTAEICAMQVLQPTPPATSVAPQPVLPRPQPTSRLGVSPSAAGPMRRPVRPETLERICVSWNKGRCSFPSCNFRHICTTCKKRGHRAKDCEETPCESPYKLQPVVPTSSAGGSV